MDIIGDMPMGNEILPTPGLYVDNDLVTLFQDTIKQLMVDMGRQIKVFMPPIASGCPNCFAGFDDSSQGLYNASNPFVLGGAYNKPFPDGGICPVCKGTHEIKTEHSAIYTALISRNPKDLEFASYGRDFTADNCYLTKTVIESFEDIKIADRALIDGAMCVPIRTPLKTGLRDLAFCRMLWQRMDK